LTWAIVVAAAALGALAGWLHMRRVVAAIGSGWRDWQDAESIGGDNAPVIRVAVTAVLLLAVAGTFMPAWSRLGIIALLLGFGAPWFLEGLRRRARES